MMIMIIIMIIIHQKEGRLREKDMEGANEKDRVEEEEKEAWDIYKDKKYSS